MKNLLILFFLCSQFLLAQNNLDEMILSNTVENVDIDMINNLPFKKVKINGKYYNFLIDTGAPTYISSSIYKDLKLKTISSSGNVDANNNRRVISETIVPKIEFGDVVFENVNASVFDFKGFEFECLNIDGIIGENILSKGIWKFDFENKNFTVTEDIEKFNLDNSYNKILFKTHNQKTPLIPLKIGNTTVNFKFDTGFSGYLSIDKKIVDPNDFDNVAVNGSTNISAFGVSKTVENYFIKINSVEIKDFALVNQIFLTGNKNLIGNTFLREFNVIMDWKSSSMYLQKKENAKLMTDVKSLGFGIIFSDKGYVISTIIDQLKEVKIGDQIIKYNNIDLRNIDSNDACKFYLNQTLDNFKKAELEIKRGKKILNVILNEKQYL